MLLVAWDLRLYNAPPRPYGLDLRGGWACSVGHRQLCKHVVPARASSRLDPTHVYRTKRRVEDHRDRKNQVDTTHPDEGVDQSQLRSSRYLQLILTSSARGPNSHRDDDLAARVALGQVSNSRCDLAKGVGPVDGRLELTCLDELPQGDQVGGVL